jgi:small subunit ribosomal protein S1
LSDTLNPTRDDFAAMLEESFSSGSALEGTVVKGTIVAVENDLAIIDVGLKTEGRVALKEFSVPGEEANLAVGDVVEVFLDRIENAMGEAVLSREKARREEAWVRLESLAALKVASLLTWTALLRSCRVHKWTFALFVTSPH